MRPMSRTTAGLLELRGTEALTLELRGTLDPDRARALVAPWRPIVSDDGAELELLVFDMRGLRPKGLPGPRLDYREALWRIGIEHDGAPAWLGHTCDLDHSLVRALGRYLVRYPVRTATFDLEGDDPVTIRVAASGHALSVSAGATAEVPPAEPPRPIVVRSGPRAYRIPWREDPTPDRHRARVTVEQDDLSVVTLGVPVAWAPTGLLHRGRVHRCGLARALRPPPVA